MGNLASLNFNADTVEPSAGDFTPVPEGKYVALISDSEMKDTKSGTGQYLQLTFQIIEGQYSGRLLWARLNIRNPNSKAVEIALGELSAICRAIGVATPNDSSELHDKPLEIKVKVRKRMDTGDLTNELKGYYKLKSGSNGNGNGGRDYQAAQPKAAAPTAAASAAPSSPPWARS